MEGNNISYFLYAYTFNTQCQLFNDHQTHIHCYSSINNVLLNCLKSNTRRSPGKRKHRLIPIYIILLVNVIVVVIRSISDN